MNNEIDDKVIEIINKLPQDDLEYISNHLTFFQLQKMINSYMQKVSSLEVHQYIASTLKPEDLFIYYQAYETRGETDPAVWRHLRTIYQRGRRLEKKTKLRFPYYPDNMRIITLNFDGVIHRRDVALEGQRKARERKARERKKK